MKSNELDQVLSVLQRIAEGFPPDSEESKAIKKAAEAWLFACHQETQKAFLKFLSDCDQPLTPAQILHLRAIGVDLNKFESDTGGL